MHEALQPLTSFAQADCVGDFGNGLAVNVPQLAVHSAGPHRVPVAVSQKDESGRHGQLGGDEFTHVRALTAGFLGVGDSQRGDVPDIHAVIHGTTLFSGAALR